METVELDIEMDNSLVARTHDLARRYFGDDGEESLAQVLELAFRIRSLWGGTIKEGQRETDEAITTWEHPASQAKQENKEAVQSWLFRR